MSYKIVDNKLYEKVKKEANKLFDEKTSIYKSAWIVREYKKRGGLYLGDKGQGLKQWFKEKWIDLNRPDGKGGFKPCGRENTKNHDYPLCRPTIKINKNTPKTVSEISIEKINKLKKQKKKIKSSGRVYFK